MSTPYILALASNEATLASAGGKGASLARLAQAQLPVPAGFHITTEAYRLFVQENKLSGAILDAVEGASIEDPTSLDRAEAVIRELFGNAPVPDEVTREIREAYAGLGGGAFAVRSSATAEDLPGMSFAGQLETYLNLRNADEVIAAVRKCWASLWTARVIGYRIRNGVRADTVRIAVVVQDLIAADAAGILFTANPLTGALDEALINAAWGLGEAVVGGMVTPDTFVAELDSGKLLSQDIAVKDVMTVRLESGTAEVAVPEERRRMASLTPQQVFELARLGRAIQHLYGMPMDVEWAVQEGSISILQARPVTALPEPRVVLDWTAPRRHGRYARSSVIELLPEPLSPLFRTLGLPAFTAAMRWLFEDTMGLKSAIPASYQLVTINDFAYYDFGATPGEVWRVLRSVPGALPRVIRMMRAATARWKKQYAIYAEAVSRWTAEPLEKRTLAELLEGARELCLQAASYYVTIQAGILPVAYSAESMFTRLYDKFAKRTGDPSATVFLLGFDSIPIRSEKSLYDLAAASDVEFKALFAAHLERFGHAIYDLDFAKPLPFEDTAPLLETVKYFASGEARNPNERQAQAAAARETATEELLARLGFLRRPVFRWILGIAQRFSPRREDALADVGMGWLIVRRMLLEVGRRLQVAGVIASADDVFWLEVGELAAGTAGLEDVVATRRAKWERERRVTPPVILPVEKGARLFGIDFSGSLPAKSEQGAGNTIHGAGSSPGRVTGMARVIRGPAEFSEMKPGDILVAKATTPAWTTLFALASGIVTDVGGALSHSSIVAREYQIPAVLGTGVATERIRRGQQITVDGDAGVVTLH